MARMLAEQWFGFFMRPKTAADAWLVQGLAGHLEEKFIQRYMGRNELEYRCVCLALSRLCPDSVLPLHGLVYSSSLHSEILGYLFVLCQYFGSTFRSQSALPQTEVPCAMAGGHYLMLRGRLWA